MIGITRTTGVGGLFLALLLLPACTNELTVRSTFPTPLIQPVPQSAALYFAPEFREYVYTEESDDRGKWIIATGDAQVALFSTVFGRLFAGVEQIDRLPAPDSPAASDLVLHPRMLEFQYSVPRETQFKVYEVWMKYNISALDARGQLIADWIVTGYGKTPTAFMQSDEEAMNAAAVVALRDLGANLSLNTPRVPEIRTWLETRNRLAAKPPAAREAPLELEDD